MIDLLMCQKRTLELYCWCPALLESGVLAERKEIVVSRIYVWKIVSSNNF